MTTTTKTTLADFGPDSVWFTSIGIPAGIDIDLTEVEDPDTGQFVPMDPYDVETAIPFKWSLEGTVEEFDGFDIWTWDGEGHPTDWNRCTVTAITACQRTED